MSTRNILVLSWCIVLFVCTCTINFRLLADQGIVMFQLDRHPRLGDLFMVSDIRLGSDYYVMQKIGHFTGFLILTLLATAGTRTLGAYHKGIQIAAGYAVFTELLQPFFGRDGRIVDMFIDGAGIALAAYLVWRTSSRIQRSAGRRSKAFF